jgi:hypothetical protein
MNNLAAKFHDYRWIARRRQIIAERGDCCQDCGQSPGAGEYLTVSSSAYPKNLDPWQYPEDILRCVCNVCLNDRRIEEEEAKAEFARLCAKFSWQDIHEVARCLKRLNENEEPPDYREALVALGSKRPHP